MKKHIVPLLCAALLLCTAAPTALADCPPGYRSAASSASAAEAAEQTVNPTYSGPYYPVSVEEYSEAGETRIRKIYQLSLSDDPGLIPTGDFTRDGRIYRLLDITQKDEVGVDTKDHTETVTQDSDTGEIAEILKVLPAQKKVTTKDGYTGTLLLDHTSIEVSVKGYQTSSRNLSATRSYPSLSDADLSLIPKSVSDGGTQLALGDVQWSNDGTYFTATATYTGTSTSRYATGYTVIASYKGQVAKTNCEVATYTAVYGGEPISEPDASTVETVDSADGLTDGQGAAAEMALETDSGNSRRHREENAQTDENTSEAKETDTVDPVVLARENRIITAICAVSCAIGILGLLGLLLLVLQNLRGRKEKKAKEEGGQKET